MLTITQALRDIGIVVPDRAYPFQIRCPFHGTSDIHPSARVYPATDSFFCWTCHKNYNPIAVIATYHGISYSDALKSVVERYGATISKTTTVGQRLDRMLAELIKCTADIPEAQPQIDELLCRAGRGDTESRLIEDIQEMFTKLFPTVAPRPSRASPDLRSY